MNLNLESICLKVVALTRKTSQFIKEECDSFDLGKIEHKSPVDLVSYVDKETEKKLVKALSEILPEAGFITEEGTVAQATTGLKWVVDPLDGTTNFLHKLPPFSISIALMNEKEELLVGVVHEITLDECFYAWKGGGAWCNEKRIYVSPINTVSASLIAIGFPYNLMGNNDKYFDIIKKFVEHSHGLRRLGSAAADLAYVACGRFNAYFEFNLKIWDIAAGILLVREAGGTISDFKGADDFLYGKELLATGNTHHEMLSVISKGWGY
jgi:myo-inositol-1(or 4)-monophosphatase